MNAPPAFQFYAADYLSSSKVQRMTLEAEGAYIRLLAYSWQDGSIPSDMVQLSRMCKCSPKKMSALWDEFLRECFIETEPGKLVNRRLEEVRASLASYKAERSESGSKGAAKRWRSHNSANGSAIKEPLAKNGSPSPSPSPNTEEKKNTGELPRAEKRPRPDDPAYEHFAGEFKAHLGTAYVHKNGDFVQLAAQRKANGLTVRDMPSGWERAVKNYFGSPLPTWTLADLCVKYATYLNSTTDRFNVPVNHSGNGNGSKESHAERVARRNREITLEVDQQLSGPTGNGSGDRSDERAQGALLPGAK